jgi:hypothetical protein
VEKYGTAGQATDDNIKKDKEGYKDTLKMCIPIAFPRQKWLRERASVLRYTYVASLV